MLTQNWRFSFALHLRGAKDSNNFPLKMLWSEEYGCTVMLLAKECTKSFLWNQKKYVRFDLCSTHSERIKEDKICMVSFLNRFAENSQKSFAPAESLIVDEHYSWQVRCRFTQYMPNKLDTFGIKFWILADLETKYCLDIIPYLGKDEIEMTVSAHTLWCSLCNHI